MKKSLAVVLPALLLAFPGVPAFARGNALQWVDATYLPTIGYVDGAYFVTTGHNPWVGAGNWNAMVTRLNLTTVPGTSIQRRVETGWIKYVNTAGQIWYTAFAENKDSTGDWLYLVDIPYSEVDTLASYTERLAPGSNTWRYWYWTPDTNGWRYLDLSNDGGSTPATAFQLGGDANGCPSNLLNPHGLWGFQFRATLTEVKWYYYNGSGQLPDCSTGQCNFGSNPIWNKPTGSLYNGGTLYVSTNGVCSP